MRAEKWRCILGCMASMLTMTALVARAPRLARIGLSLAIAAQAVAIALSLSEELSAGAAIRIAASPQARDQHSRALEEIAAAHLFGAAPAKTRLASAAAVSYAPLVLTGIIATGDPRNGLAIVGTSVESARTIYVGSEAAPGTVLIKVFPLWVVLQRGSERLTLHLTRKDLVAGATRAAYRGVLNEDSAPAPESAGDSGGGPFAMHALPTRPPVSNDAAVLDSFGLAPATTIDGRDGMRIAGTAFNSKTLAALGLHAGDVIVQINGVAIDAQNAPDLNHALQSGNATLTVDRNGDDTSVTLDQSSMADAAALYRQADPDL